MNQRAFILRITPSGIDRVPEALSENQIIIGWAKAKGLLNPSLTWEQFREILRQKYYSGEDTFQRAGAAAGHMWRFIRKMNKGDFVVVPHRSEFYVADVEGPAIYHENKVVDDTAYRRPCKWLNSKKTIHRDLANVGLVSRMKPEGTCTDATDFLDEIKECLRSDSSQQAPIFQNELKPRITRETITERHMQDYLYDNPRVLFPSGTTGEERNYIQQDSLKFGRKVQQKTEIESVLSDGEKVSPLIAHLLKRLKDVVYEDVPLSSRCLFVYGPVCIDRRHRGQGILEGLSNTMLQTLKGQYDVGIAFVSERNPRSLHAHQVKLGMKVVDESEFNGQKYRTLVFGLEGNVNK